MPPISLSYLNKNQVSSFQRLEVDLIDPTRKLYIFSGIAIPSFEIDDNDNIHRITVNVDLGLSLVDFQQGVAQVGLASIANAESEFVLAIDDARVDAISGTGAVTLSVDLAVSGDDSAINRFGFQVVVVGGIHATGVSGRVTWDRDFLDGSKLTSGQIASLFVVNANTVEHVPGESDNFATTKLHPIASAIPQSVHSEGHQFWAPYSFDHLPLNTPLRILVALSSAFPPGCGAGQVHGPLEITLRPNHLSEGGVDFLVSRTFTK